MHANSCTKLQIIDFTWHDQFSLKSKQLCGKINCTGKMDNSCGIDVKMDISLFNVTEPRDWSNRVKRRMYTLDRNSQRQKSQHRHLKVHFIACSQDNSANIGD